MNAKTNLERELFSSRIASILTMLGMSIGLGNVWRFPYMMGKFGGSAFLFIYLICVFIFAVPALTAELALGRVTRKGPLGAMVAAYGPRIGPWVGYLLLLTVLIANSYYLVVISQVLHTTWFCAFMGFTEETTPVFQQQLANGTVLMSECLVIILITLYVIHKGLNKGIEIWSRVMVPFFMVVAAALIVYTLTLEGAIEKMKVFLTPDFAAVDASVFFGALGQAFFSIGLGGTFLLMYGSYISEKQSVLNSSVATAVGDTSASLLASLFIIPTILVFGLDMTSGPNLIFVTLPTLFGEMPGGRFFGTLFLLAVTNVAFLSNVASIEVLVGGLKDESRIHWSKGKTILVIGVLQILLSIPSAYHQTLIGHLDLIFGSGMQTLGSALAAIGLTWGLGKVISLQQIMPGNSRYAQVYFLWLKWVVPGSLLAILISYIYKVVTGS